MKPIFNKETTLHVGKTYWLLQLRFLLPLITTVTIAFYAIVIRPYLMPTMKTVPIELGFAFILILSLVVAIATLFISIIITAIIAVYTRTRTRIILWLLKLRSQLIVTVILVFINVVSVICSQWMAYTPPILGDNGNQLVGSIAVLEKVTLDGSEQWITIRGKNKNNPVLLFLAGGPGGTQLAATRN